MKTFYHFTRHEVLRDPGTQMIRYTFHPGADDEQNINDISFEIYPEDELGRPIWVDDELIDEESIDDLLVWLAEYARHVPSGASGDGMSFEERVDLVHKIVERAYNGLAEKRDRCKYKLECTRQLRASCEAAEVQLMAELEDFEAELAKQP